VADATGEGAGLSKFYGDAWPPACPV